MNTNDQLMKIIAHIIITILIIASPIVLYFSDYKGTPIFISLIPLGLFFAMRIVNFMNEIESGLVCAILSILIAFLIASINKIKRNEYKNTNTASSSLPICESNQSLNGSGLRHVILLGSAFSPAPLILC